VEMGRRRLGLLGMRSSEGVLEELWIYLGFSLSARTACPRHCDFGV